MRAAHVFAALFAAGRGLLRCAFLSLLMLPGALLGGVAAANAAEWRTPVLFIVHSYADDDLVGPLQHKGVMQALLDQGILPERDFKLHTVYLDTRRANAATQATVAARVRAEIDRAKPNVIVTLDDAAFSQVGMAYIDRPEVSVVFSGVNRQLEDYNQIRRFMESREKPGHNVTGVYEKLHVLDAIRIQAEIQPGLRKIVVINDESEIGQILGRQVTNELVSESGWERTAVRNWEEYQQAIQTINKRDDVDVIYPVALLLRDAQGNVHNTESIMRWTAQNSLKPELALSWPMCQYGLFGGVVVDYVGMGAQAGRMAGQILRGAKAGNIPIEDAQSFRLVFNYGKAQRLRIDIPEDILMTADEIVR